MTTKRPHLLTTLLLTVLVLASCMETKTGDAKDAYHYWAGTNPPADLELLKGQYWQSAHWTKEYTLYLKFKPTEEWWSAFLTQNDISVDTENWNVPSDAPTWFTPSDHSTRYGGGDDFDQGSRYFRDTITGVCYVFEVQR